MKTTRWDRFCCFFGFHTIRRTVTRLVHHELECVHCKMKFIDSLFGIFKKE